MAVEDTTRSLIRSAMVWEGVYWLSGTMAFYWFEDDLVFVVDFWFVAARDAAAETSDSCWNFRAQRRRREGEKERDRSRRQIPIVILESFGEEVCWVSLLLQMGWIGDGGITPFSSRRILTPISSPLVLEVLLYSVHRLPKNQNQSLSNTPRPLTWHVESVLCWYFILSTSPSYWTADVIFNHFLFNFILKLLNRNTSSMDFGHIFNVSTLVIDLVALLAQSKTFSIRNVAQISWIICSKLCGFIRLYFCFKCPKPQKSRGLTSAPLTIMSDFEMNWIPVFLNTELMKGNVSFEVWTGAMS